MAVTLFDLTYELARALGVIAESVATGGSTTTIADSVERVEDSDYWNGGSAWILWDSAGAGAAPEKEYSAIGDYTITGGVITLRSTLTAAVAAGDKYAVASARYPLQLLKQKINESFGVIPKTDTTTIVIASDQLEYTMPSDVLDLKEVYIQTNDETANNDWQRVYDWDVQKSATGSADKLVLMRQFTSGYSIKLVYLAYHSDLVAASDKLDDNIHKKKIIYNAAVSCLLWRKAKVGDSDMTVNELLNYYQALASQVNQEYAQNLPHKASKTIHPVFR